MVLKHYAKRIIAVVYQGCVFESRLGKNKNLLVKKYLFVVKY